MGGVINIVTKRPTKSKINASIGKSSYGGAQGNLQVDAPLGSGSIMFGLNREQSDGDFKYTNKSNDIYRQERLYWYNKEINDSPNSVNSALSNDIGFGMNSPSGGNAITFDELAIRVSHGGDIYNVFWDATNPAQDPSSFGGLDSMQTYYYNNYGKYADPEYKNKLYKDHGLDKLETSDRYRKANDYKNTDAIIKWQDDHWLAKATWKQIKRHLPFPYDLNYGNLPFIDLNHVYEYPLDIWYHRNQKLTAKEALLGRRDTSGNLEWGWSINYLNQNKNYFVDNWQWIEQNAGAVLNTYSANSLWSKFDSRKLGFKIDGTYKITDAHLIEFLLNSSTEKMDIDGWRMHDFKNSSKDTRSRWRNYYEQSILNAQIQDTITLNNRKDLWFTPSLRYNRSTIIGRSERYDANNDPQKVKWFHQEDKQTDDKVTWQMALKKVFNENFTVRATSGTYYRLLNMYEIAGDGAGIWPMPNVGGTDSVFPLPEEGRQWDLSAIWDGQVLGAATSKFQLTYFARSSEHLLQLMNRHFFLFYTNAAKAKVNGLELQADLSWSKWDLNLQGTYTKPYDVSYDQNCLPGYDKNTSFGYLTYQPKYEGTTRLTYKPSKKWNFFTQLRYVGGMYIDAIPELTGTVSKQSSLTTLDFGIKCKPQENIQIVLGVNDITNKANDMYRSGNFNIYYPIQGRNYYATINYNF